MTANFAWKVNRSNWLPEQFPNRPYSVTTVELARACPLRCRFEASEGFERRTNPAGRIGVALHRALQKLTNRRPDEDAIRVVQLAFETELQAQKLAAQARPREVRLQWDAGRIHAALATLITEAQRTAVNERTRRLRSQVEAVRSPRAEIPVSSADGLFSGIVDRFEVLPDGRSRLIDFKSAYRPDFPAHYERQVQMYAFMWRDTFGAGPDEGAVYYPLSYRQHKVDVSAEAIAAIEIEARRLIEELERPGPGGYAARPGEACRFCEFKPWCSPFWAWTSVGPPGERLDKMRLGVEGVVISVLRSGSAAQIGLRLESSITASFVADDGQFPHLSRLDIDDRVRVLDTEVGGMRTSPTLKMRPQSEVFLVV